MSDEPLKCPCCQQKIDVKDIIDDAKGQLVFHPGRQWPCRVKPEDTIDTGAEVA